MSPAKRPPTTTRPRPASDDPLAPVRPRRQSGARRFRERRNAVARDAGHRRLLLLGAVFAVIALFASAVLLVHSSLFAARHIDVVGNRHTSTAAVIEATGLGHATPLIDIDSAAVASAVERLPWVATAVVKRAWPETVRITVTEAAPIAYASVPGGTALFDGRGRVLEDLAATAALPAHLVPLGSFAAPTPGASLPDTDLPLLQVAGALPVSTLPQILALERQSEVGVVAVFRSGATVIFGSAAELGAKMVALVTLLKHSLITTNVRVDLRVPAAPVLTR